MSNKVNVKNPKNENFDFYQEKVQSLLAKTASNLFKDKYFYEEFKSVYLLSLGLKVVSSLISFSTMILAIHIATRLFFGYYPSLFFAVSVGLGLEGLKTFLWRINSKWTLKYKQVSKIIVFVLVLLHLTSLGGSAYGGWMLPTYVDEIKTETPVFVQNDSVLTALSTSLEGINSQIRETSAEIAKTSSNSTKRSISANLVLLLEQRSIKENEISEIRKGLRLEQEAFEQEEMKKTQALMIDRQSEISTARISCLLATVFFELLFIICACFCVYYLFRYTIDQELGNEVDPNASNAVLSVGNGNVSLSRQPIENTPVIDKPKTTPTPAPIGFFVRCQDSGTESPNVGVFSGLSDSKGKMIECAFDSCSNVFKKVVHNKKFCSDECRKLSHQIDVYESKKQAKKYYACSVAHTKKADPFLVFLESEELDFEGRLRVVDDLSLAHEFKRDRSNERFLYLDEATLGSVVNGTQIENNAENLKELGLAWKGYNLVKNFKTSKS